MKGKFHSSNISFCSLSTAAVAPKPGNLDINRAYRRQTWSLGVYSDGNPFRAVDGNFNPNFNDDSVHISSSANHAWFAVDLKFSYEIDRVVATIQDSSGTLFTSFYTELMHISDCKELNIALNILGGSFKSNCYYSVT